MICSSKGQPAMFTDPCSHSASLLLNGSSKLLAYHALAFSGAAIFGQNCSCSFPACSNLLPKARTRVILLSNLPSPCIALHVCSSSLLHRACGCRKLCMVLLFQERAKHSRTFCTQNARSVPQQPLTPRSINCVFRAITWELTDWPMGIREHSSAYCFTQK